MLRVISKNSRKKRLKALWLSGEGWTRNSWQVLAELSVKTRYGTYYGKSTVLTLSRASNNRRSTLLCI